MKKIYKQPMTQIFNVEIQEPLMQISRSEKEIDAEDAGLTKENDSDWGSIWDE